MYTASIQSTNIYPDDFTQIQAFVRFDCGDGSPIVKSYVYSSGGDPLDQINADLTNLNTSLAATLTSITDIQAALVKTPMKNVSIDPMAIATQDQAIAAQDATVTSDQNAT